MSAAEVELQRATAALLHGSATSSRSNLVCVVSAAHVSAVSQRSERCRPRLSDSSAGKVAAAFDDPQVTRCSAAERPGYTRNRCRTASWLNPSTCLHRLASRSGLATVLVFFCTVAVRDPAADMGSDAQHTPVTDRCCSLSLFPTVLQEEQRKGETMTVYTSCQGTTHTRTHTPFFFSARSRPGAPGGGNLGLNLP